MVNVVVILVLAIVYEQYTKEKQSQRSNVNAINLLQNSQFLWNNFILFCLNYLSFEGKFTMIDQEKHEIEQVLYLGPHYYCINYV